MSMTIQEAIKQLDGAEVLLLNRKGFVFNEAIKMAITALWEKAEREDPKPLTLEELRQMDGEPVWVIGTYFAGGSWQGWDIIERVDHDGILFGYSTEFTEWWNYNLRYADGTLCGCAWCAYRHKPKGE